MALFLDANVPMYASGGNHPLKQPAASIIRLVAANSGSFVTDAEVLQEILHRYRSQRLWARGRPIFDDFTQLMSGRIEAVTVDDVKAAADLGERYPDPDARDLIHMAFMMNRGISEVVSADHGFDGVTGIERLDLLDVEAIEAKL